MKHLYIVRIHSLDKILHKFRKNPMILFALFETFFKCSLNVIIHYYPIIPVMMPEKSSYC